VFFLLKKVREQLRVIVLEELIQSQWFKVGLFVVIGIKLVEIDMEEDFAPEMLRDHWIGFFQKVNDLVLVVLIWNEVKDLADEVVESEFGVVFCVDLKDLFLAQVDQLMGRQPESSVPDVLDKVADHSTVVDRADVVHVEVALPLFVFDRVPDPVVEADFLVGLELCLGFGSIGQQFGNVFEEDNQLDLAQFNNLLKNLLVSHTINELETPQHHSDLHDF
jgi:hypothetical protein